jgi:hypothetical protein
MPPKRKLEVESYESIEARIQEAIDDLEKRDEEKPNLAAAAREFEIPITRLRARWNGRRSKCDVPGPNKRLSEDQELAVCLYLDRLDDIGTCARKKMVTSCANAILADAHEDPNTEPPLVGPRWTKRFLDRHPEYFIRKQSTMDIDRKNAHDPEAFRKWFAEFKKICDQYGIQPRDIYNFDETGFRIGIGKDQWIITRDPDRQAYLGSSTNRELVTVCETISADGDALPPMIILSGILHQEKWYTKLPDNYLVGVSETGYSNDELSMDWLKHFDRFSARRCLGAHRLLLLDGYGSHCTKEFIDYCDEHKIIPFCLPPHTSHLLQPLDVVVFQPYKHYHAEAVEVATRTGCVKYDKAEFLDAIHDIRRQTFKPSSIFSAFRKTGLVPYNPDVVLAKMREAASATPPSTPRRRAQYSDSDAEPETPETPLTIRTLKRLYKEIVHDAAALDTPPSFQDKLRAGLKGGLHQQKGLNCILSLLLLISPQSS